MVWLWELKGDLLASELLVNTGECICLVFNVGLLGLVQMNLEKAGSIEPNSDSLSNNLCRVDKVIQDGVVYSHQGAGSWSLLLQLVCLPGGLGKDSPLGNEHNVLAAELLLEFSHKPGLNLLECLLLRNRHEDDNSLLAPGTVDLLGGGDVELPEGGLQVAVDLKIQESLADLLLNLIRLLVISLHNFSSSQSHSSLVEVNQAILAW